MLELSLAIMAFFTLLGLLLELFPHKFLFIKLVPDHLSLSSFSKWPTLEQCAGREKAIFVIRILGLIVILFGVIVGLQFLR